MMPEPERLYLDFGQRVRRARGPVTQAALAARLGMTRSSIANLEAGRQRIPLHTFLQLADTLGVIPTALLPELATSRREGPAVDISAEPESTQEFIRGALASIGLSVTTAAS